MEDLRVPIHILVGLCAFSILGGVLIQMLAARERWKPKGEHCLCGHTDNVHRDDVNHYCVVDQCDCCSFVAGNSQADIEVEELRKMLRLK